MSINPNNIERASDIINEVYKIKRDKENIKQLAKSVVDTEKGLETIRFTLKENPSSDANTPTDYMPFGLQYLKAFSEGLSGRGYGYEKEITIATPLSPDTSLFILELMLEDLKNKEKALYKELEGLV